MRLVAPTALFFFLALNIFAQSESLPDVLKPDAESQAEAKRTGANVFKVVPFGMYADAPSSYRDEDNPIGIRGGGSFYSFTSQSHSYNRTPEIQVGDMLNAAMLAGISFFADLGERGIETIDASMPEAAYFMSYKAPLLWKDYSPERAQLKGMNVDGLTLSPHPRSIVGHTYLLRVITLERSDIAVALQIYKKAPDGSFTILWKRLAEFPKPIALYQPDKDLQAEVDTIIKNEDLTGVRIVVKNNWLYSLGPNHIDSLKVEASLKRKGIMYRGAGGTAPVDVQLR